MGPPAPWWSSCFGFIIRRRSCSSAPSSPASTLGIAAIAANRRRTRWQSPRKHAPGRGWQRRDADELSAAHAATKHSLSPVLGGAGRGEGASLHRGTPPHPPPLPPHYRGEGRNLCSTRG